MGEPPNQEGPEWGRALRLGVPRCGGNKTKEHRGRGPVGHWMGRGRGAGVKAELTISVLPPTEPKPPKGRQSQKEAELSPTEPLPPTPPPESQEGAPDEEKPGEREWLGAILGQFRGWGGPGGGATGCGTCLTPPLRQRLRPRKCCLCASRWRAQSPSPLQSVRHAPKGEDPTANHNLATSPVITLTF